MRPPPQFVAGCLSIVAATLSCAAAAAAATEWPQWRGPRADGSIEQPARSGAWPDELPLLWKRRIGGGYSGPVLRGDRVWVHSRQGDDEVVRCFRLAGGEIVWRSSHAAPFRQDDDATAHGRGPYATPALAGPRLFTLSIDAVLSAWDATDGKLLWRKRSADEFDPAFPHFGAAASPVVWEGLVFAHLGGHERQPMAHPSQGAMIAFRVEDGSEAWRWTGDAPGLGATPLVARIGDTTQLVFKTLKLIVAVDPATGRELWRIPYTVTMDNTIVTPLFVGGLLITSDYEWGIAAWEIAHGDGGWKARQRWKHREVSMFMSSPVVAGGLVCGFSHLRRGQLFLLDPSGGEVRWLGGPRAGEHATLLAWGDDVLVFTGGGTLIVARVEGRGLQERGRYELGDACGWAHPAIVGDRLVYRDGDELVVRGLPAR